MSTSMKSTMRITYMAIAAVFVAIALVLGASYTTAHAVADSGSKEYKSKGFRFTKYSKKTVYIDEYYGKKTSITIPTTLKGKKVIGVNIFWSHGKKLKKVNLKKAKYLKYFTCNGYNIKTFDFSKNKKLEEINVSENKLTSIKLGKLSKLNKLYCTDNNLTSINCSQCPLLFDDWGEIMADDGVTIIS